MSANQRIFYKINILHDGLEYQKRKLQQLESISEILLSYLRSKSELDGSNTASSSTSQNNVRNLEILKRVREDWGVLNSFQLPISTIAEFQAAKETIPEIIEEYEETITRSKELMQMFYTHSIDSIISKNEELLSRYIATDQKNHQLYLNYLNLLGLIGCSCSFTPSGEERVDELVFQFFFNIEATKEIFQILESELDSLNIHISKLDRSEIGTDRRENIPICSMNVENITSICYRLSEKLHQIIYVYRSVEYVMMILNGEVSSERFPEQRRYTAKYRLELGKWFLDSNKHFVSRIQTNLSSILKSDYNILAFYLKNLNNDENVIDANLSYLSTMKSKLEMNALENIYEDIKSFKIIWPKNFLRNLAMSVTRETNERELLGKMLFETYNILYIQSRHAGNVFSYYSEIMLPENIREWYNFKINNDSHDDSKVLKQLYQMFCEKTMPQAKSKRSITPFFYSPVKERKEKALNIQMSNHHIIPSAVLIKFVDKIISKFDKVLLQQLTNVCVTLENRIESELNLSDLNLIGEHERNRIYRLVNGYRFIPRDRNRSEYIIQKGDPRLFTIFNWLPGNTMQGPRDRSDDPKNKFEENAIYVVGKRNFEPLKMI